MKRKLVRVDKRTWTLRIGIVFSDNRNNADC